MAVNGQLDRAATSIPLNIAEGNGKYKQWRDMIEYKTKVEHSIRQLTDSMLILFSSDFSGRIVLWFLAAPR